MPDPSRRTLRRSPAVEEIKSPVRPLGFIPPARRYREVAQGQFVQVETGE